MIPGQSSVTVRRMLRSSRILFILVCFEWLAAPAPALAQFELGGCKVWLQQAPEFNKLNENFMKLIGVANNPVIVDCDQTQLVADEMELYKDQDRVLARGHVVYTSGNNRISAERMDFNTKTKLGTFYSAFGTATLGERVERSMFGTQEPYAYFYGDEIHKLGPKKYKIVRGGFTTCVQPTPRWEFTSGSVTLVLEDHAVLTNTLFKVKGVPLLYLPVFYYPIPEDDRSTGFLMPLYGNSTYRGSTISNQFFWAISRSQDATLVHDWFPRTGMAYGGEYRYLASSSSSGSVRTYIINEHEATFVVNGAERKTPARRNYSMRGDVSQGLPGGTRLTASVDYFTSILTQQLYQQDYFQATNRTRRWSIGTSTSKKGFTLLGAFNRDEVFLSETQSYVDGARPRISFSRSPWKLGASPVYVSGRSDFGNLQREIHSGTNFIDQSIGRFDNLGVVSVPFPTFSFLTVTSSLSYRATHYGRSIDPIDGQFVEQPLWRNYMTAGTELIGPSFVRIWHRPNSGYANRVKHLIEPRIEFTRITAVDNVDQIFKFDSADYTIGGTTNIRYGVTTRILVKPSGENAVSRNMLTVSVFQTHYSNAANSKVDTNYGTAFLGRPASAYSPISINVSYSPTQVSGISSRVEYDPILPGLQSISMSGSLRHPVAEVSGDYSHRRLSSGIIDPTNPNRTAGTSSDLFGTSANVHTRRNTVGGTFAMNYDFGFKTLVQQRMMFYYNAQCCGVGFEYQQWNYPSGFSQFVIPQDRRFNISFSLAGVGTFSNFLGALTGQPTRR
jgi:LPS-assembly protein